MQANPALSASQPAAPPKPTLLDLARGALERLDVEGLSGLYAADAEVEDASTGVRYRGKEEIHGMFAELFAAPGAEFIRVATREGPGWGVIEWTWSAAPRGSKERSRVRGLSLLDVRGGKIARETYYYDPRAAGP